jgi:hypothetical protein
MPTQKRYHFIFGHHNVITFLCTPWFRQGRKQAIKHAVGIAVTVQVMDGVTFHNWERTTETGISPHSNRYGIPMAVEGKMAMQKKVLKQNCSEMCCLCYQKIKFLPLLWVKVNLSLCFVLTEHHAMKAY